MLKKKKKGKPFQLHVHWVRFILKVAEIKIEKKTCWAWLWDYCRLPAVPSSVKAWTCCLRLRLKYFLSISGVKLHNGVRVLADDLPKERTLAAPATAPRRLPRPLCPTAGWRQGTKSGLCLLPWSCRWDPANVRMMLHFLSVALNDAINQQQ